MAHAKPDGRPCSHARYRIDCREFDALVNHADNRCQLCGRTGADTGHGHLVIDHDALLGEWAVRGLLCSSCNLRIEYGETDPAATAAYLGTPWHSQHAARLTVEPPVGSAIRAGRRRFERTAVGWEPRDGYRGRAITWQRLTHRYGLHNLTQA